MKRLLPYGLVACALSSCTHEEKKDTVLGGNLPRAAAADRSRCDTSGKRVVELDVNGDKKPDVWKIYAPGMDNGNRIEILTCKEVDLNFDGKKDELLYYDNAQNLMLEELDLDFDGKIDEWVYYQNGKAIRREFDTNFDGQADVWQFYENEKLARIERSSRKNGRIDVWEYYEGGKLDRIGYDTLGSGQVDRWDRAPEETPAANAAAATPPGNTAGATAPSVHGAKK